MKKVNKILIVILFIILESGFLNAQNKKIEKPFFFIQMTDPQFGMFENNKGFAKETALFEKAIVEINRLKPDFVVITGDLVNNWKDASQIAEFKRLTAMINSKIPVYYTPGNHDVGNDPTKQSQDAYITNFKYDKFSFKHKGSLFIGFNSSLIKANLPEPEKKQYQWLKKKLGKSKKAVHVVLFCHYPFFIKSFEEAETYSNISIEKRKKYFELFKKNNVKVVFSGHLHNNAIAKYNSVKMVTTSAVGKPLGNAPSGFRIVKVYNDNIESDYYGLDDVPEKIIFNNCYPVKK